MTGGDEGLRLPRLQSSADLEGSATTLITDVVAELAHLAKPTSRPRLNAEVGSIVLSPEEGVVVSLMLADLDLGSIVKRSPLSEDETLKFIARLVTLGLVTFPAT
jgi:hypothetical protein